MRTLPYLGAREYVHGTTLLDAFLDEVGDVEQIEMVIREEVVGSVGFSPTSAPLALGQRVRGVISVTRGEAPRQAWNIVDDCEPHDVRDADYEEQALVGSMVVGNTASQEHAPSGTSAIQRIVAMNKVLLDRLYPSNKWLFVRLKLSAIPQSGQSVSVTHEPLVQAKLKRSRIEVAGAHQGDVQFWCR